MTLIGELKDGERAKIQLAIRKKYGIREYRSRFGKYFMLEAGDRTGNVIVKYWGTNDEVTERLYSELKEGDVIEIDGEYHKEDSPYISVDPRYDVMEKTENYDRSNFVQQIADIDNIMNQILRYVEKVEESHLSQLLNLFFSSSHFIDSFRDAPGSTVGLYAALGGLAKHTLNVTHSSDKLAEIYSLNQDFLITAALLHDIGRIESYDVDTSIRMGNRGKLLGHTLISYNMVEEKIREIVDFPADMRDKLLHAIISHHSPVVDNVPQRLRTRESYILFYADMLDISMGEFDEESDEVWKYSRKIII